MPIIEATAAVQQDGGVGTEVLGTQLAVKAAAPRTAVCTAHIKAEQWHARPRYLRQLLGVRQITPAAVVLMEAVESQLWLRWLQRAAKLLNIMPDAPPAMGRRQTYLEDALLLLLRLRWEALAQLRTGSHWQAEQTGRWLLPPQPRHARISPHCRQGVEDAAHMVYDCPCMHLSASAGIAGFLSIPPHSSHFRRARPLPPGRLCRCLPKAV